MSDIKFNCPQCETHLAVDATGAGTTVACPNCGLSILVPNFARMAGTGSSGRAKWRLLSTGVTAAILVAGLWVWQTHMRPTTPIASRPASKQNASTSLGMADKSASPEPAADQRLFFKLDGSNNLAFDTGVVRGSLQKDGAGEALKSITFVNPEITIDGTNHGLLTPYRFLTAQKRYGFGSWEWPRTGKVLPDGSAELHWEATADRPFTFSTGYRWKAADTLDFTVSFGPRVDLEKFELFLGSYFLNFKKTKAFVKDAGNGASGFIEVSDQIEGGYQLFPSGPEVLPVLNDGRWNFPPFPITWTVRNSLAAPLGMKVEPKSGVTVLIMSPPEDCFALSATKPSWSQGAFYLSLFGKDVKRGETLLGHVRLVFGRNISDAEALQKYSEYLQDLKNRKDEGLMNLAEMEFPKPANASTPATTPASATPKTPQIWFAPFLFGQGAPAWQNGFGAHDYLDLFKEGARWNEASSRVQVFKFYLNVFNSLSDAQLEQVVHDLNRRGIAIGVEAYLIWTDRSSQPVESVARNAAAATLRIARRIKAAGGTLRYIAMDEPFLKGSFQSSANGGGLPVEEVARLVAGYVQSVKGEFPDVIIGDIEYQSTEEGIERAMEAYHAVSGEYFPFLHLDVEGGDSHWPERAKALENYTHARGIAFGIIYNGNMHDPTDAAWLKQAGDHMTAYETLAGGRPDQVIFQSWAEHPHYLLPETDPSKFTWLINHYFAQRTVLNVGFGSSPPDQSREAIGKLTTSTGDPVGGAQIEMSVKPVDGPAQFAEYTLRGVVPLHAGQGVFGFRVNTKENPSQGACDFALYDVSYREGTEVSQRIPNGDFSQGLKDWTLWSQYGRLQRSDRGPGQMLKVTTTATQMAGLNSAPFTVTEGAAYTVTFKACVAPAATGSGYFAIIFPGASESFKGYRQTLPVEAATQTYSAMTERDGSFRLKLTRLMPGRATLQGRYDGDNGHWSTYSRIEQ